MKAYVFPGQGAQFEGMGQDLYESSEAAKAVFDKADEVLGFGLSKIMFEGSAEELKQTKVTQPALFVHGIAKQVSLGDSFVPDAVAGHSLGEFTALVASGAISFEDGLKLVYERALAMQAACDDHPGTMAAILGLEDAQVEQLCSDIEDVVVAANYNCPGQLVISGSVDGIAKAVDAAKEAGARRALVLPVGGAFHSPLMAGAKDRLEKAIDATTVSTPKCPVYQNVTAEPTTDATTIKQNLKDQLTGAVRWTQTIQNMETNGIQQFVECGGSGKVLSGLIRKVNRQLEIVAE